jgi:transposase
MENGISYVGLDVHKSEIVVALYKAGEETPKEWRLGTDARSVKRLAQRLLEESAGRVECVYEAGPTGFVLQRQMTGLGVKCEVAAPSLVPVKPGQHIRTDRRDARKLGRYLRSGDLTMVRAPSEAEEAARELCRHRTTVSQQLTSAKQRVSQMLLRCGRVYRKKHGTKLHRDWLRAQRFEQSHLEGVFTDLLSEVDWLETRLGEVERKVEALAETEPYQERVGWVRCLRGFDTLSAVTLLTELHGIERFTSSRGLMAFLGLVPKEDSSGPRQRRGSITHAGNSHVRWLLVQSAWNQRFQVRVSEALRRRRKDQPAEVIALADRAMKRLHERYVHLLWTRGVPSQKVAVAVARETVGFLWALLVEYPQQRRQPQL